MDYGDKYTGFSTKVLFNSKTWIFNFIDSINENAIEKISYHCWQIRILLKDGSTIFCTNDIRDFLGGRANRVYIEPGIKVKEDDRYLIESMIVYNPIIGKDWIEDADE